MCRDNLILGILKFLYQLCSISKTYNICSECWAGFQDQPPPHVRSPWGLRPGVGINTAQIENFAQGNDIMKYHTDQISIKNLMLASCQLPLLDLLEILTVIIPS